MVPLGIVCPENPRTQLSIYVGRVTTIQHWNGQYFPFSYRGLNPSRILFVCLKWLLNWGVHLDRTIMGCVRLPKPCEGDRGQLYLQMSLLSPQLWFTYWWHIWKLVAASYIAEATEQSLDSLELGSATVVGKWQPLGSSWTHLWLPACPCPSSM